MRLMDCFMELLAYVVYFLKTVSQRQPTLDQVKSDIDRLVVQADTCAQREGLGGDDYEQARFAIFAWVDEVILNSGWQAKAEWQRQMLQRQHYQTTEAGELFFERLNDLGPHQRDVREVYYLCLAMGFTGRYCNPGDEFLIDQLKTSNLKVLLGSSVDLPALEKERLFPEAYSQTTEPVPAQKPKSKFDALTLMGIGFPIVLFAVIFLIYHFILSQIGKNLLETVL
jgi:type VI secretion system protein ImpK